MQVSAITSAYTGSQRQTQNQLFGGKNPEGKNFEDYLYPPSNSGAAMEMSDAELDAAIERAMTRIETLVGEDVAEDIINDNGSINLARFAQVMSATDSPYTNGNPATFVNAPQMVNLIA